MAEEMTGQQILFTNAVLDDDGNAKGSPPPDKPTDVPKAQVEASKTTAQENS
jgi:hypothetical protein